MKKKLLSILLALTMLIAITALAAAAEGGGFTDVDEGDWYAEAAAYVQDNDLMSGATDATFAPNDAMTRAMLVTVLYRAAGAPAVTTPPTFSDMTAESWYANAVSWAVQRNIISGYGNGLFGPNDPVSREQIAAILWKYDGSPTAEAGTDFADEGVISAFASTAVDWAHAKGIVNGKENNRFDPSGNATRAEVATMLMNYLRGNPSAPAPAPTPEPDDGPKVLVAYFSATNTTEALAGNLSDALDATLYEITPETPYTSADLNYNDSSSRSTIEMNQSASRPALSGSVVQMEQYDIVFLGYPIWSGQAPRIISTFLESYDFGEKTIVPFCTSGSSGIGSSATDLHALTDGANWLAGQRFGGSTSRSVIVDWVNGLDLDVTAK